MLRVCVGLGPGAVRSRSKGRGAISPARLAWCQRARNDDARAVDRREHEAKHRSNDKHRSDVSQQKHRSQDKASERPSRW